jgi:hypothetical protein
MAKQKVKYFYLDQELHRVLRVSRPEDLVVSWNFPQHKRKAYVWSDTRRKMEKAFSLRQVCDMLGRSRVAIELYIRQGKIRTPQRIYTLDGKAKPGKYFFSEKDVLELHDYILSVHIGRPRRDGRVTPAKAPSKAELRAMMKHDTVMYIKSGEEFVPVWKEIDW